MSENILNQYNQEVSVNYRGEDYLVRDNGAICRLPHMFKSKRPNDNRWTFGNRATGGYMQIGHVVIHRIVATAFHGEPPSDSHVVDHIDTNRQNNQPENLRWVTRAENLYGNPITKQRIDNIWGSIESMLGYYRTAGVEIISDSLTHMALQKYWKTPCEFPMCPEGITTGEGEDDRLEYGSDPLGQYLNRLTFGSVFSRNIYGESLTTNADWIEDSLALSVITNLSGNGIKEWAVAKVTFEDGNFIHESISTFFTLHGALKEHCKIVGVSLDESIDDYC